MAVASNVAAGAGSPMVPTDAHARARLKAIGIDVWVDRRRAFQTAAKPVVQADAGPAAAGRIRLQPGDGEWLLVFDGEVPASHAGLVRDIVHAIGPDRCRYGHWARSGETGASPEEWTARGISGVLAFGPCPIEDPRLFQAGALSELAADGRRRRLLWQHLRAH